MISHPLYVWNHTHCMCDTIGTLYDITSTLGDTIPLYVCHGTHYDYDIISSIYDVTHTVLWIHKLYICLETCYNCHHIHCIFLHIHSVCRRHYTNYVRHHRWHMYAIICTTNDIISTLYDNSWNLWHHMHCIHGIKRTIYDMSSTVYHITYMICVTSHNACIYDITNSMTYPLYIASHTVLWQHSHYVWHHTQCIYVVTCHVPI